LPRFERSSYVEHVFVYQINHFFHKHHLCQSMLLILPALQKPLAAKTNKVRIFFFLFFCYFPFFHRYTIELDCLFETNGLHGPLEIPEMESSALEEYASPVDRSHPPCGAFLSQNSVVKISVHRCQNQYKSSKRKNPLLKPVSS
jgi:hypothetical protein